MQTHVWSDQDSRKVPVIDCRLSKLISCSCFNGYRVQHRQPTWTPPLLPIVLVEWDSHFKSLFHSVIQTDKTSRFIFVVFMLVCVVRSKLRIAETGIYLAEILCCITVSLTFLHVLESCAEKDRSNSMITYGSFIARVLLPYLNI